MADVKKSNNARRNASSGEVMGSVKEANGGLSEKKSTVSSQAPKVWRP